MCRPISVGAMEPVGMTKASASNVLNKNASAKAIAMASMVSRTPRDKLDESPPAGRGAGVGEPDEDDVDADWIMLRFYLINPMRAKLGKKGKGIFVPGSSSNECGQKIKRALPISKSRLTYFSSIHSRASRLAGLLSPSMKN